MLTRKSIEKKINANEDKIKALKQQNRNLYLQSLELSDKKQWFTEENEEVKVRDGRKIKKEIWLRGFIHWKESFMDEDTGNVFEIERCQEVKRNGIWIV